MILKGTTHKNISPRNRAFGEGAKQFIKTVDYKIFEIIWLLGGVYACNNRLFVIKICLIPDFLKYWSSDSKTTIYVHCAFEVKPESIHCSHLAHTFRKNTNILILSQMSNTRIIINELSNLVTFFMKLASSYRS